MTEPTASPDVTGLLGCPFCGGAAYLRQWSDAARVECALTVRQDTCGFSMRTYPTRAEAIAAWNRRAPDLALRQEVERLRGALIAAGRAAGAGLADTVSTDFLMHAPDEVAAALRLATQRREDVLEVARAIEIVDGLTGYSGEGTEAQNDGFGMFARGVRFAKREITKSLRALALQPKEN